MPSIENLPLIQKDASIPKSGDYDLLLAEGIERIGQYSGDLWNNYNDSDPGITILQSLCYAMTELGFKSNLPVEDILTGADGRIVYENRFEKPEAILPINPVSLRDFKRRVLDEVPALKQIYFDLAGQEKLLNTYQPYLELKPAYLNDSKDPAFRCELKARVDLVLQSCSNLGQLFLKPKLLLKYRLPLSGRLQISPAVVPEVFIAQLLYALNNYLSPYPVYLSYGELLQQGLSNAEILEGPDCKYGFLPDNYFQPKRRSIQLQELMALVSDLDGVEWVETLQLPGESTTTVAGVPHVDIPRDLAPYFDPASLEDGTDALQIIQNGRPVLSFSVNKVQYEWAKITPQPQAALDLQPYLPKGRYRDIGAYYSIQHHFPKAYGLTNTPGGAHADPIRAAKIRQLKAYLALPEQILANYLSQLSHAGDLFSFESGRNLFQVAGPTYYFQDLYEVPGIRDLLKDVSGYSQPAAAADREAAWKAYRRDPFNPYRQELMAAGESPEVNLDRKSRVLRHLLARFGSQYQPDFLHFNNPDYGDQRTAEVEHISTRLRQFALVSSNRSRTYFPLEDHPEIIRAGIEWSAQNELGLSSYYQGLDETIREALEMRPDSLSVLYYDAVKNPRVVYGNRQLPYPKDPLPHWIGVYHRQELLMAFIKEGFSSRSLTLDELQDLLYPYLQTLRTLSSRSAGFVFIDNIRLLEGLYFQWELRGQDPASVLYRSPLKDLYRLEVLWDLLNGQGALQLDKKGDDYVIEIKGHRGWEPICDSTSSEAAAQMHQALLNFRKRGQSPIRFWAYAENSENGKKTALDPSTFQNRITALFPDWVALLQSPAYRQFLEEKMLAISPLDNHLDLFCLDQPEMDACLALFSTWMEGRAADKKQQLRQCRKDELTAIKISRNSSAGRIAAIGIIDQLNKANHHAAQ